MLTRLIEILVPLLVVIESSGNDKALGKHGEAGCLQLKTIAVDDCNRVLAKQGKPERYTYSDRFDRSKSVEMCKIILAEYGAKLEADGDLSLQSLSLVWNCGYTAYKTGKRNQAYLDKVRKELDRQARRAK